MDYFEPTDPNIIDNIAVLHHCTHSRIRVYPQDVTETKTLVANAAANIFGLWAEIVPINIIDFEYEIVGIDIEAVNAATTYHFQLGFSTVALTEPTTAQIMGERRGKIVTVPIAKATELMDFYSMECPANAKLWGRLKTASTNADEAEISVGITRHMEITNPIAHLITFPWGT